MSVHILRLPALPWRVIIDPETRSLYNKADNWVFFFIWDKWKPFCGIIFPPYNCPDPQKGGMMIARSLRKEEKQTPKVRSLWRNKFQFHGKAGLHEGHIKESKLPSGPFRASWPFLPLSPVHPWLQTNLLLTSTKTGTVYFLLLRIPAPSLWQGPLWVPSVAASRRRSCSRALLQPLPQGFVFRFFSSN